MLFNDSGFVRFRMGNEGTHGVPPNGLDPQGVDHVELQPTITSTEDEMKKKGLLRASQSFDEAVLQDEPQINPGGHLRKSPIYQTTSDPEQSKDELLDDFEPELEAIYEPPPIPAALAAAAAAAERGSKEGPLRGKKQSLTLTPSESDEPQYSGSTIYGRAPSQCSSISATQSFDLRMYGRLPKGPNVPLGSSVPMTSSNGSVAPLATGTLKKGEESR